MLFDTQLQVQAIELRLKTGDVDIIDRAQTRNILDFGRNSQKVLALYLKKYKYQDKKSVQENPRSEFAFKHSRSQQITTFGGILLTI